MRRGDQSVGSLDSSDDGFSKRPKDLASSKAHAVKTVKKNPRVLTDTRMFSSLDRAECPLLVDPAELVFESATPGTVFVMTFSIRNMTKTAQRIRLSPPKTTVFALNYIPAHSVAPGLDVRAEVQCCLPEDSKHFVFTDTIVASMGPHRVEIPLMGRKPSPNFSFSPSLEFGLVAEGQTSASTLYVENLGSVAGTVSLELDPSSQLSVSPKSLTLAAKGDGGVSKSCFNVKFVGNELGNYRELVSVVATGIEEPMVLDVSAQVVVQKMTLLSKSKGAVVESIDFGVLVFGQTKVVESYLVNNSPLPVTYSVRDAEEQLGALADEKSEDPSAPPPDTPIVLSPMEGTIEAYGQALIKATFTPTIPRPERGFMGSILKDLSEPTVSNLKLAIYSQESDQTVEVSLQGTAALPKFTVAPLATRFGVCPVLDRRDATLTLSNASPIAMSFDFSKTAHFKVNPSKGTLQPEQTLSVIASFTPAQLGKFKGTMRCKVSNGIRDIEVRFTGESEPSNLKKELVGGITALPEHFQPKLKFIDPEEVRRAKDGTGFKRVEPWESIDFQQTASSSLLVYEQSASMATGPNPKVEALQKKNANREVYNSFLKNATSKRLETKKKKLNESLRSRGINLRADPDGIDLGMDRGLDEPEMEIHGGKEPLWTASRGGDESKAGGGAGKGFHNDENRLIQKKFRDSPVTQADAKDCATELTPEKLKSVVASHKVINFGRVNVNSVTSKNFSVSNQMLSMVLVKLGTLESELKQSRPMAQAIPAGAVAGFDLTFSCREVCKYKKTFSWIINEHHVNKVTVLAEVIPIELLMDRKSITLEFPSSSVEASISEQLTLSNPGNANAEYVWGNEGAFECMPERGTIAPGQSAQIAVVWAPNAAHRNEGNIGLRIAGGTDCTLSVAGVFIEAKAAFDGRKMDFGTIAVGTEKKKSTHLRNTGTAPIAFWFDDMPESANMVITPKRGLIMPGETSDIFVNVFPRTASSYDGRSIVANIRGGKPAVIKLGGNAIVPEVSLEQSNISFGGVVVGSDCKMPIVIRNTGAIRVSVIFDLSSHRDFSPILESDDFVGSASVAATELSSSSSNVLLESITKSELSSALYAGGNSSIAPSQVTPGRGTPKLGQPVFENEPIGAWRLTLAPGAVFEGFLQFAPSKAKTYSFKLPVYLQGRLHESDFACEITAEGLASRLKVSAFSVDFGDKIVNRDSSIVVSYFQEVVFTNVDKVNGLSYEIREAPSTSQSEHAAGAISRTSSIDTDGGAEEIRPVYFISPTSGGLSPGESATVRLTFMPPSNGEFQKKLYIYVEGQADPTRPYFILHCRGFGVYPRLSFSKDSIVLPTVPLSVTTRASFTVFNSGYDGLELKYRVSPSVPVPLDISFPDGNELGLIIPKVKVVVSASYDSPVSWTGKIEFYDDDGEHFFLDISGCGDGCLLTNYSFVKDYSDRFGFLALDGKPVSYYCKKDMVAVRTRENKIKAAQRAQVMASKAEGNAAANNKKGSAQPQEPPLQLSNEGIDLDREAARTSGKCDSVDDRDVKFLIKWLNGYIVRRQIDVNDYLTDVLSSDGDIIIDALEQMSGKKIANLKLPDSSAGKSRGGGRMGSGAESRLANSRQATDGGSSNDLAENSESSSKRNRVKALLHKYKVMIEFIVKYGGLLMHVSPKSLLNVDDFLFAQEEELRIREGERLTTGYAKERKVMWQKEWLANCQNSWSDILFQSFKTFVLYRTSYAEYCNTPGVVAPIMPTDAASAVQTKGGNTKPKQANKGKEPEGKKNKGPKIPPEFQPSNVYSTAEALIMAWVASHLQKGTRMSSDHQVGGGTQYQATVIRRVADFDSEMGDLYGLLHVLYSHQPDLAKDKGPLSSYSAADAEHSKDAHFKRLKGALKAMQLDFNVDSEELFGSGRCFLIFVMHLFLNLPSFLPKATVEFKGALGTGKPIIKAIELRNPSQKRVTYRIQLDGSTEFSVPDSQVSLDPMSAMDVLVHCNPRFTSPARAVITFRGVRDSGFSGTNMVFNLVSVINEIRPLEVLHRNVALFDMDIVKLTVTNPFDTECLFPVSLVQKSTPTTIHQLLGMSGAAKGGPGATRNVDSVMAALMMKNNSMTSGGSTNGDKDKKEDTGAEDAQKLFSEPFWLVEQNLHLPAGGSAVVTLFALPFQLGSFSCQVVLNDPNVGQFCQEVVMSVGLPQAVEKLSMNIAKPDSGSSAQYVMKVCSSNINFDRAVLQGTEARIASNKRNKVRQYLQSLVASPQAEEGSGSCVFNVDISSPYFTARKDIQLSTGYTVLSAPPSTAPGTAPGSPDRRSAQTPASGKRAVCAKSTLEALKPGEPRPSGSDLDNAMLLAFSPEKSGTYKSRFLFYGRDNGTDMRVIELTANVTPSESAMLIEFHGACRQELVQDIPLLNESNEEWQLSATVTGKGFSVPKNVTVGPGEKMDLQVTFCSPSCGKTEGVLNLRNNSNNESYNYKLCGFAEEPLAEDTLNFKCNARTRSQFSIPLRYIEGISKSETYQTFEVETDLECISGPSQVKVSADRSAEYQFSVMSPVSGVISGSITFKEPKSEQIIWYLVELDVSAPLAERVIDLECPVRKVVGADISLENPTKEVLHFTVHLHGEGLLGEVAYSLNPSHAKVPSPPYELIYSPLITGQSAGSISFKNEVVGEFWYKVNLIATPAEATKLELIECMIGQSKTVQVPVENPLSEMVNMTVKLSDPRHFSVSSDVVTLKPYSQDIFELSFHPSSMNEIVSGHVALSNPILGEVVFEVSGKGLMPGLMPPVQVIAPMNQMASKTLAFRNPFSFPLPLDVILTSHAANEKNRSSSPQTLSPRNGDLTSAFSLLLRKPTGLVIAPDSSLQLGIAFAPEKLGKYSAAVELRATLPGRNLLWCYPIFGMAAAGEPVLLPKMTTPVKSSMIKDVHIPLSGLLRENISGSGRVDLNENDITIEQVVSPEYRTQLARSFKIQLLEVVSLNDHPSTESSKSGSYALRLRLLFEPLRIMHTEVEIGIVCKDRGRWRADVELEAVEPPPDDTIRLVAKVGGSDKVAFTISNRFLGHSPFQAFFRSHSSPHFTVTPSSGVLAPYGSDGTQFVVSFSPKEYGTRERGLLTIQTEESQWTYEILGSYPDVSIDNSIVKSKLNLGHSSQLR